MSDAEPRQTLPEGEEHEPRGARAMAVIRWGLVALMALAAGASMLYYFDRLPGTAPGAPRYYCPMHPSVVQDQPGDCPICGMSLVARTARPARQGHDHAAAAAPFACPLHPQQVSADPQATCPICGARMERTAAVPGLAPLELSTDRVQLIGMRTALVRRERLVPEIRTVGAVSASERGLAQVHTRFSGWIEELAVNTTGERVRRGQVLATIYSPQLLAAQQELLNARRWARAPASGEEARLTALGSDARRRLELLGISAPEIDAIIRAGQPLRALKLRSPATGVVTQKGAVAGLYVQPGTLLFEVADLSRVWVIAEVYEHELARVRLGQRATLALDAYPGETFDGVVRFIYPTVDPASRTLRLRVEHANRDLRLRPGMYGQVTIAAAAADGLTVPAEAVVDDGETQYVFVDRGQGRFTAQKVKVGVRATGRVQVVSGLAENDRVVTTGNFLLDSESRLQAAIAGSAADAPAPHGH
jgi:membrane fusion protein, copper/silver efflux system